jgi:phage N-6-adenine-methyltransferase
MYFSSRSGIWETPQTLFDALNSRFSFDLDVCALPSNAKCPSFYTPEVNGLAQEWTGVCWMNPPYGKEIPLWLAKANEAAQQGATVVCLLPVRTDTQWWRDYVQHHEIEFLPGRLKSKGAEHYAPYPSAVVVMRPSKAVRLLADQVDDPRYSAAD